MDYTLLITEKCDYMHAIQNQTYIDLCMFLCLQVVSGNIV